MAPGKFDYYDFFAGGGMTRLGLGRNWHCLLANDHCPKKARAYCLNFPPGKEYDCRDVAQLAHDKLPGRPTLAWASFPCQDLSLAGGRQGFRGKRSSAFWPFWRLIENFSAAKRPIPLIVLENVTGAITSHNGRDFHAIVKTLAKGGYCFGPLVIDSAHFTPQSRRRLFIVAVQSELEIPHKLLQTEPDELWSSHALRNACCALPATLQKKWLWWRLPEPLPRQTILADLIEDNPGTVDWHSPAETKRLLGMMSEHHQRKVEKAQSRNTIVIGAAFKRMRRNRSGKSEQRLEVRFDDLAGCLRTPTGGSSRQFILQVKGAQIRTRLLSPREAARLMGAPDSYQLPEKRNEAYQLMGDALVVPVVEWLEHCLLRPLARISA